MSLAALWLLPAAHSRVVLRLLQMSTTADGLGATWSTSREKTYKKVKRIWRISPPGLYCYITRVVLRVPALARAACHRLLTLGFLGLFFFLRLQTSV